MILGKNFTLALLPRQLRDSEDVWLEVVSGGSGGSENNSGNDR